MEEKRINSLIKKQKGITLIALIITIIVLLILAGISVNFLFGENSIIERGKEAKFKTHFREIEEKVNLYKLDKQTKAQIEGITNSRLEQLPLGRKTTDEDKNNFKDTLKKEIETLSGTYDNLYYIDQDKISTKKPHTYIIDVQTEQIYDVEGEKFFKKWHHTLNENNEENVPENIVEDDPVIRQEGEIGWYSPDMTGFNKSSTYLVYYDETMTQTKEVPIETYIENEQPKQIDNYTLDDYKNKKWANAKTNANGLECWWVWIPRYAYKVNESSQKMDVIFIDLNNKPIGTQYEDLPSDYIVHPGFTITDGNENKKELKGIWVSKYEASNNTTHEMTSDLCYGPDMSGFDKEYTYIELYNSETSTFDNEIKLVNANIDTINNNNKWYDYSKKQWANIKTNANGLECWWVWIPRYAYHISEGNQQTEIIFIDINNKPIDKEMYGNRLPEGFIVHPGFDVEGKKLKGIWVSKYEASNNTTHEMSTDLCYAPDLNGFDKNYTYIELYNTETATFIEEKCLSDIDEDTVNNDNKWYDYSKKQWANIKTNANGLECWWVWIPRYAYYISEGNQETEIIFIDLDNKPMDKTRYGNELPERFTVHPSFDVEGKKLKGIWVSKYEASNVSDVVGGTVPIGASTLPYASDTAGKSHTHSGIGAGITQREVPTTSTKWCSGYDGTPCSKYGYYIYCSECGVRLRHYWCAAHCDLSTKVIIDDSNI